MLEIAVSTFLLWTLWPSLEALWGKRLRLVWQRLLRPLLRYARTMLRFLSQRLLAPVFQLLRRVMSR